MNAAEPWIGWAKEALSANTCWQERMPLIRSFIGFVASMSKRPSEVLSRCVLICWVSTAFSYKGITTRLDGIDSRLDNLDARGGRIEDDVHALRDEMVHRREFEDVLDRMKYIEKKLGIESGV
jgi:hypothetical protein